MSLQEAVREFESMLEEIARYQNPCTSSVEAFFREYGVDLEPPPTTRPTVQGLSSSAVIREIREGRW